MSQRAPPTARNHRKLPSLPPVRRQQQPPAFWPTYRSAVHWMTNHRDIFETAFDLVQIHPKLMRNRACDKLYELMSKVSLTGKMKSVADLQLDPATLPGSVHGGPKAKLPDVPTISVSRAPGTEAEPGRRGHAKHVFVTGVDTDGKWAKIILSLTQNYFVKCSNKGLDGNDDNVKSVYDADAFIFLMDEQSVANEHCLHQLRAAMKLKVKVIYVRESSFKQPTAMQILASLSRGHGTTPVAAKPGSSFRDNKSEDTANHLSDSDISFSRRFLESSSPFFVENDKNLAPGSTSFLRHDSSLSASSYYSAPDLHDIARYGQSNKNNVFHKPEREFSSTYTLTSTAAHDTNNDIVSAITDGYNKALVYNKQHHFEFIFALRMELGKTSVTLNILDRKREHLATPTSGDSRASSRQDSPVQEMDISLTPEPEIHDVIKDRRVPNKHDDIDDLACQDTVYLIYPNEREKANTPTVFHWPSDYINENTGVSNSPSIDSFGFQDVDLSKSINTVDIFSDEDSD